MFRPEGHEKYTTSDYMKLEDGDNKIRILEDPIVGYEYWEFPDGKIVPKGVLGGPGSKPVRMRESEKFSNAQIAAMKMFTAMVVWNYQLEKVQILELTQTKIMSALDMLYDNKAWGDLKDYPIVIKREKTGPDPMNVAYTVMPEPKEKLPASGDNALAKVVPVKSSRPK